MPIGRNNVAAAARRPDDPVNFAYLQSQTFGDVALEGELLQLFLDQAQRLVPTLPERAASDQADTTHLLKGSARAVGANAVATALEAFEAAPPSERGSGKPLFTALVTALAAEAAAIEERLAVIAAGST